MRIYTKTGDHGETRLLMGGQVPKNHPRCEAYGEADFATSAMGMARAISSNSRVKDALLKTQREMFTVMSELAIESDRYHHFKENYNTITEEHVTHAERLIDDMKEEVELPPKFIIPGASPASGAIDLARSALRSAERRIVELNQKFPLDNDQILPYVNRLGDLLFMLARYEDKDLPWDIVTGTRIEDSEDEQSS